MKKIIEKIILLSLIAGLCYFLGSIIGSLIG